LSGFIKSGGAAKCLTLNLSEQCTGMRQSSLKLDSFGVTAGTEA
jgi:hypothetical protein